MLLHGGAQRCPTLCWEYRGAPASPVDSQPSFPHGAACKGSDARDPMAQKGTARTALLTPTQPPSRLSVGPALCQLHWAYHYKKVVVWRWGEGPLSCHPGGMEPSCTGAVCELPEDVHRGTAGTWTPLSGYLSCWLVCTWGVWGPLQR